MKSERMKIVGGRQKKTRKAPARKKRVAGSPKEARLLPAGYLNSKAAKLKFDSLKKHLESAAITYTVDSELLNITVVWLMIFDFYAREMIDYIHNPGLVSNPMLVVHDTGAEQVSAGYSIMNKATDQIQNCFKLLGVGPYSRSKIKEFLDQTQDKQDEGDPFAIASHG